MSISIEKAANLKSKPDSKKLGFGKYFTDYMFVAKYTAEKGWDSGKIIPYQNLQIDPGASVLHYGQALFEGMKAFRQKDGKCVLYRPELNWKRMCDGAERLCMVAPPKELFLNALHELVKLEQDWIPNEEGCSLYIRPTLIGTEAFLGVRPATEMLFFVILSPVGSYYSGGLEPVRIWIEQKYLRAAPGGLGATKAAANYAGSLKAAAEAKKKGCAQVLWLDVDRKYVDEVGTMNVFFVFENEVVTPELSGTILPGGMRDSIIQILKSWNVPVRERKVSLEEIKDGLKSGKLKEVFGSGTAAVVSPVGELVLENEELVIHQGKIGELSQKLYAEVTGIQNGTRKDGFGWMVPV